MKKLFIALTASLFLLTFLIAVPKHSRQVQAQGDTQERLDQLNEEIEQYEQEIKKLQAQANTLKNQIAQYDAQIRLTTLKIVETEEKISLLGNRIELIEVSLNSLSEAFAGRAEQTYKMTRFGEPVMVLFTTPSLNNAVSSYHYLKKIQEADRELLIRLEKTQSDYKEEKNEQEELQEELEIQNVNLNSQKAAKNNLLVVTRNDEQRYQELLAAARAEFEAIQAIIAGKGDETEVGSVSEGEKIASIIQGASCNSSGAHLHFIVSQKSETHNPFSYLKSGVSVENCSGSSCGSGDGDTFNPSGSWNWPISDPIRYTQGYGSTWAVRNTWVGRIYSFHNGIDINSKSSSEVKAVRSGTLYQGSYSGYQGCRLRYVRVDHNDSDLETFYLHINY